MGGLDTRVKASLVSSSFKDERPMFVSSNLGYVLQSNFSEESSLANLMGGIVDKSRKTFQLLGENKPLLKNNRLAVV